MTTARKITCTGLIFTLSFISTLAANTQDNADLPHCLNTYKKKKHLNFLKEHLLTVTLMVHARVEKWGGGRVGVSPSYYYMPIILQNYWAKFCHNSKCL